MFLFLKMLMDRSGFPTVVLAVLVFAIVGCFGDVKASCTSASFAAPQAVNVRARGVAMADFNGDGWPDIIAAADFSSTVYLIINNSGQGFFSPVTFSIGGWPGSIAVGDFNNDQKADVVTANFNPASISILFGNGAGSFAEPVNIPVGDSSSSAVAVGDFNGDQNQDLAVANPGGTVAILLGTGSGSFTGPTSFPAGERTRSIAVADFNLDGYSDLATVQQFSSQVSVLFGNGSGGFGSAAFNAGPEPSSIVAQDFNNDGRPDLAIALSVNMAVLINNGDETFSAPTILAVAGSSPSGVVTADFNNDGQYDLAVGHNTGVSVRFGNGNGTFASEANFLIGLGPTNLAAEDLDGDGSADLAVSSYSDSTLSFVSNDGSGGFKIASRFSNNFDARSVVARDFNSDGKIDLAVANRNGNTVSVYLGDGMGAFAAARVFSVGAPPSSNITNGPFSLAAADFNGDTKLDLVTANFTGASVTILSGDGTGSFAAEKIALAGSPHYLITGDFNLDEKADVAVTRSGHFSIVTILFGNGNGGFSGQTDFDTGMPIPESLTAGDLNADGKPDLVVGSTNGSSFSVLLNGGSGGFGAPTSYSSNNNAGQGSVATIGDFTGDGKVDLVVANYLRDTLALFPGNGAGVFADPSFVNVGQWPSSLVSVDFNGDGLLDVATAYTTSGAISVLQNNGAGGFVAPKNYLAGAPHEFLAVADFNGDSLPDLATEAINVFLNSCSSTIAPLAPTLTISNVSVGESPINAMFEVSLSSASSQTVSVRYQTTGQSAVAGADFQITAGTLSFAPGEIVKSVEVPLLDDSLNEFTETFFLSLHHPVNADIKKGQGIGSIVDSDPVPTVTLNSVFVVEGNSGIAQANFAIALSSLSGKLIQITYSTADISATAGSDYQSASNVGLRIWAGSPPPASISILVNGDTAIEPDETFSVNILNPVNVNTTGAHATGTIIDDDAAASLNLLLEESGPNSIQAAALDALLFIRDPFRVLSKADFWNFGTADRNTRVIVFVSDLTLNPGETASAVTVTLTDSSGETRDVVAENVRAVPNFNFTQVTFRLPDGLPAGNCLIRIKVHGQMSNAGTIRIAF